MIGKRERRGRKGSSRGEMRAKNSAWERCDAANVEEKAGRKGGNGGRKRKKGKKGNTGGGKEKQGILANRRRQCLGRKVFRNTRR